MNVVNTVSGTNIAAMLVTMGVSMILPLILCIIWKIYTKAKLSAFFIGCGTFVLSALVLEKILHTIVLTAAGDLLRSNIWFYAIYGGLAAGLFEETGRYLAMRFCMAKSLKKENAIMYGIGHGGIESILVVGITYLSNLMMSVMINGGGLDSILAVLDENTAAAAYAQLSQLWTLAPADFLLAGVERISAVMLHIVLSWLVYRAVKGKKPGCYLAAVGIHFAVDAGTVLLQQKLPGVALEGILLALMAGMLVCVARDYRKSGQHVQAE